VPAADTNPDMSALAAAPGLEEWHLDLHGHGAVREEAVARLHGLLVRAARFEVFRRQGSLPQLSAAELEGLAQEAADDAAYKFALLEASVKVRRRAWRQREVTFERERWETLPHLGPGPDDGAESAALLDAVREGIKTALTPRQRQVLVACVLEGVPIDVLAERLDSNRNALYKTLHDARQKLRAHVAAAGYLEGTS
jgi:RNA polymerase sigma-70 factor, ECF subfamily